MNKAEYLAAAERFSAFNGDELSDDRTLGRIEGQQQAHLMYLYRMSIDGLGWSREKVIEMLKHDVETHTMLLDAEPGLRVFRHSFESRKLRDFIPGEPGVLSSFVGNPAASKEMLTAAVRAYAAAGKLTKREEQQLDHVLDQLFKQEEDEK
jgi:hypothetical protein